MSEPRALPALLVPTSDVASLQQSILTLIYAVEALSHNVQTLDEQVKALDELAKFTTPP